MDINSAVTPVENAVTDRGSAVTHVESAATDGESAATDEESAVTDTDLFYAPLVVVCLLLFGGCSKSEENRLRGEPVQTISTSSGSEITTNRDSIFSFLGDIDQETFRMAFGHLAQRDFTRYARTEQFDHEEYLIAFQEQVARHQGTPLNRRFETLERDSAGTFEFGYFSPFVSKTAPSHDPADLAPYVIPEDPAYLSARSRDAYSYRFLPDTLMWDMIARVVEVNARPGEGDGQNIRRIRLFVDKDTNLLIALYLERINTGMWYHEESQIYVQIRSAQDGSWVPYNTRFETRIAVPFRPKQRFRMVAAYYAYAENANR